MIVSSLLTLVLAADASAATTKQVVLDKQATISVPTDWEAKSYSMPVRGSVNFRITSADLRMAITSIPGGKSDADDKPAMIAALMKDIPEEEKIKFDVVNASMQYVLLGGKPYAQDESPTFKGTGYVGALMTVTSPSQEAIFPVFEGKKYQCVTTSIIKTEKTSYVISVGSDSCSSSSHSAAVSAIKSIVIAGG